MRLLVDERLDPQADPIDADLHHRVQSRLRYLPRRAFHRDFRIRIDVELLPYRPEQPLNEVRLEERRRPPAQINRVNTMG